MATSDLRQQPESDQCKRPDILTWLAGVDGKDGDTGMATHATQCHLKRHWHVPISLNRPISWDDQAKKAASWWVDQANILQAAALHPRDHKVLLVTDASNEGLWSKAERSLHMNVLELKAVLSLQHFRDQGSHHNFK